MKPVHKIIMCKPFFNSLTASLILLITFANSLDPDQAKLKVVPDLAAKCLTLWWYPWKNFWKTLNNQQIKKSWEKLPSSKELNILVACQKGQDKQGRPISECFFRTNLIRVFSVCYSGKHVAISSPKKTTFGLRRKKTTCLRDFQHSETQRACSATETS